MENGEYGDIINDYDIIKKIDEESLNNWVGKYYKISYGVTLYKKGLIKPPV